MTIPKLPWRDLEESVRVPILYHDRPTRLDFARFFNVEPQTIDRWRKNGIPWPTADRIAVTYCNRHPGTIWPAWWTLEAQP